MLDAKFDHAIVLWSNESASHGLLATDSDFVIRGWNCWLERQSPFLASDVMGRPLFEVLPELIEHHLDQLYRDALGGRSQVLRRFDARLKKEHAARISPLMQDGSIIGTITLLEDISERLALEAAAKAKDEFLARLSHDLRVPLSSIVGWISLLKARRVDETMFDRAIETMERSVAVQIQLLDDLLDVSRIASGKLQLHLEAVDLVQVLHVSAAAFQPMAESKHIQILEAVPAQEIIAYVDKNRMQQVLSNLISNALKFTPAGGFVEVGVRTDQSRAELLVRDNGIGISSNALPHIFEPFWQADATSAASAKGLGLGLSIVRQLVEKHGGSIRAESPGNSGGTSFFIDLPLTTKMLRI